MPQLLYSQVLCTLQPSHKRVMQKKKSHKITIPKANKILVGHDGSGGGAPEDRHQDNKGAADEVQHHVAQ
ncbi:hypothetical protein JTE90_025929 [Oedothorax gibbosus]|uniref:Uncharacterized protein n=1 Tax=Oedothorax gibbosus TaxID=931172 RepID=A0AAV6UB24_9ARAC|nr:hypothetical protein JTE90_025929 [Oedothorax gibbosus]